MAKIRLDKWIASTGIASRKEVKLYAKQGRITVNGTAVRSAEEKLDPETDVVLLDGKAISYQEFAYVMMHKPAGVLSATEDNRQKTVLDLLPPELQKQELFAKGYIAKQSSHSRGSTVDLTLLDMSTGKELDMGSPFDLFSEVSHPDYKGITEEQYANRMTLQHAMMRNGFRPFPCEWWHFTLGNEPYPDTYFDFPVSSSYLRR